MKNNTTIKCPHCGNQVNIEDVLYHQMEAKLYEEKKKRDLHYQKEVEALKNREEALKAQQEAFDEELKRQTDIQLKAQKETLQKALRKEILDEQNEAMALLKNELTQKSEQVKELNSTKAQIERLKREKDEMESAIKLNIESDFNQKLSEERAKFQLEAESLKQEESKKLAQILNEKEYQIKELNKSKEKISLLEKQKNDELLKVQAEFEKILSEKLRIEKLKTQEETKQKIIQETQEQFDDLQKELTQKSQQVQELHKSKIEIERLKREKEEMESAIMAKAEVTLNEQLKIEKAKIKKIVEEQNELKLKEKEKQLDDQKRLIEEMKRKAEQGSMQLQGEIQELAIEEWLSSQFRFDTITEVKKGAFGADCIQSVHTREAQNCGIICYESKNTKTWSGDWISKLKENMLRVKADIGVIVSAVYPKDMDRMGFVDGIWVCNLEEFKGSVSLLRESVIRTHKLTAKEENKADKSVLLYNYLSGNEFGMQMKSIVMNASQLKIDLDKEKKAFIKIWKQREKMIEGMINSIGAIEGDLVGISGNKLSLSHAFELPYSEE